MKIGTIVIRCYEFDKMMSFWQEAPGYVPARPPGEGFVILTDTKGKACLSMNIRAIRESDGEQFLLLGKSLDQETQFMMLEPGERRLTIEEQRQRIRNVLCRDNQVIFIAEHEDRLVGYLGAFGGDFNRNRHSAHIVVGILQEYTGQGIGKQLFEALDAWAIDHKIHRLELTVMSHNARAVHLYQKMGFKMEGLKQDSLWVNGQYVHEYYMAKILMNPQESVELH